VLYPGEVKAPNHTSHEPSLGIFLGGSIEMGSAVDWQSEVVSMIKHKTLFLDFMKLAIYNPRRDDWDSSWTQDPAYGTQFNEQVAWELDHLNKSNIIIFNFEAGTISPITLLELGLHLGTEATKFVVCPTDYHRYGNVKLTAALEGKNVKFYEKRDETFYKDLLLEVQRKLIV
jgi:hypothetical protein